MEFDIKHHPLASSRYSFIFIFFQKNMIVDYASEKCDSEQILLWSWIIFDSLMTGAQAKSRISMILRILQTLIPSHIFPKCYLKPVSESPASGWVASLILVSAQMRLSRPVLCIPRPKPIMLEPPKNSSASRTSDSGRNSLQSKVVSRENPPQNKVSARRSPDYLERPERYQRPGYDQIHQADAPGRFGIGHPSWKIRDLLMYFGLWSALIECFGRCFDYLVFTQINPDKENQIILQKPR